MLGSVSVRLGLGFGPGIGGLIAQYSDDPLRLPFELHLVALAAGGGDRGDPARDGTVRSRRPLTLRLEVPAAERAVFWRVLVPSGALFSLFDGVALSLIPVFLVRTLGVDNYALVGAAGFLVLVSGAVSQLVLPRLAPERAIGWGLAAASLASVGVVAVRAGRVGRAGALLGGGHRRRRGAGLQGGPRPLHPDRAGRRTAASCCPPTTSPATWAASRCRCWWSGCCRTWSA